MSIEDLLFSPIEPRPTVEGKFDGIAIAGKYNCTWRSRGSTGCFWDGSRLCEKAMRCVDVDNPYEPTPKFK
jgi:hypothetical protein